MMDHTSADCLCEEIKEFIEKIPDNTDQKKDFKHLLKLVSRACQIICEVECGEGPAGTENDAIRECFEMVPTHVEPSYRTLKFISD